MLHTMDTHLFVEITVQQCDQGTLQAVHSVEDVVINLFKVAVVCLGAGQRHQKLHTEQRYKQDGGSCHPPAQTELVTRIAFNDKYSDTSANEDNSFRNHIR